MTRQGEGAAGDGGREGRDPPVRYSCGLDTPHNPPAVKVPPAPAAHDSIAIGRNFRTAREHSAGPRRNPCAAGPRGVSVSLVPPELLAPALEFQVNPCADPPRGAGSQWVRALRRCARRVVPEFCATKEAACHSAKHAARQRSHGGLPAANVHQIRRRARVGGCTSLQHTRTSRPRLAGHP